MDRICKIVGGCRCGTGRVELIRNERYGGGEWISFTITYGMVKVIHKQEFYLYMCPGKLL